MGPHLAADTSQVPQAAEAATPAERHGPRWWPPLAVCAAFVAAGMAYSLFWAPVVRHAPYWVTPGDLWGIVRQAHFVGWGALGLMYSAPGDAAPGMAIVLAPVAMLSSALHLSEELPFWPPGIPPLAHPSSWLLFGPVELVVGSLPLLLAADAILRRFATSTPRRLVVLALVGAAVWQASAIWGHAEDAAALGLGLMGLLAACDERFVAAAWWFGAALVLQPLVGLMAPIALGFGGRRRVVGMAARMAGPFAVLAALALAANPGPSVHALVDQPLFPTIGWPTPLVEMAHRISATRPTTLHTLALGPHWTRVSMTLHLPGVVEVTGSPTRLGALAVALGLGWLATRRRGDLGFALVAATAALASRVVTEAVLFPYYAAPAAAMGLLAALVPWEAERSARGAWSLALVAAGGAAVASWLRLGEWGNWLLALGEGVVLVAAAWLATRGAHRASCAPIPTPRSASASP
jgi:hypothetical protein